MWTVTRSGLHALRLCHNGLSATNSIVDQIREFTGPRPRMAPPPIMPTGANDYGSR